MVFPGEFQERFDIFSLNIDVVRDFRSPGVPGSDKEVVYPGILGNLPGNSVFPGPAADNQYFYFISPPFHRVTYFSPL